MDFDELKEAVSANEVILAQLVGSKLYGVSNPKDEDVLVVVDKMDKKWSFRPEGEDVFVITNEEYKQHLQSGYEDRRGTRTLCAFLNNEAAKTNLKNVVYYGESPARNTSLFDNKKEVFERVIKFGDKNFFNPSIRNGRGMHGCPKFMSWALWYYYAFQNGSMELTKEQQNTIQLCHDGNLPLEYRVELRKKIMGLLNG